MTNPAGDVFGINWPTQKQAEKEISDLVRRGVNLLYIYSGGVPVYYNYRNQFKHMFRSIDFMGRIQDEFFKSADHTYTLLEQREKLIRCICAWMREKFT